MGGGAGGGGGGLRYARMGFQAGKWNFLGGSAAPSEKNRIVPLCHWPVLHSSSAYKWNDLYLAKSSCVGTNQHSTRATLSSTTLDSLPLEEKSAGY